MVPSKDLTPLSRLPRREEVIPLEQITMQLNDFQVSMFMMNCDNIECLFLSSIDAPIENNSKWIFCGQTSYFHPS
jgi:hypothetical protein